MAKIAIIGAGINGLVLAVGLRQLGFAAKDIDIYEKGPSARAEGTGIVFWAEAIQVMQQIGVDLRKSGVCLSKLESIFLRETGDPVAVPIEAATGKEAYGFLRKKIYNALLDRVKEYGLKVQTGFECQNISENNNRCTITFKNKDKPVFADVVIGCDGINSVVRSHIFPSVKPTSLNIRAYRGIYTGSNQDIARLKLPASNDWRIYCGSNSRVILYPNFADNTKNTTSYYWFAAHRIDPAELNSPISHDITDEHINALLKRMPRCPDNLKNLFKETQRQHIILSSTLRQLSFSACSKGRIALLGDAAHAMAPTAGLGCLLGPINALFLAGYLKLHRDNFPQALQQYDAKITNHSRDFLSYTSQLTQQFYVETPMQTVQKAKETYAQLSKLAAQATSDSLSFYNKILLSQPVSLDNDRCFFPGSSGESDTDGIYVKSVLTTF